MSPDLDALFRELDRLSRLPSSHDSTVYGTARSSPSTFYAHHTAVHSAAVVFADALTISVAAGVLLRSASLGLAS